MLHWDLLEHTKKDRELIKEALIDEFISGGILFIFILILTFIVLTF